MTHLEALGDRMKAYEGVEAGRRLMPLLPVLARIDGRAFHSFTRGMMRPFDADLSACMVETTVALVKETGACVGYTQSDEITLAWHSPSLAQPIWFDGRVAKMTSQLAALATLPALLYPGAGAVACLGQPAAYLRRPGVERPYPGRSRKRVPLAGGRRHQEQHQYGRKRLLQRQGAGGEVQRGTAGTAVCQGDQLERVPCGLQTRGLRPTAGARQALHHE